MVFSVPAVAQKRVRNSRGLELGFGHSVLGSQADRRYVGVQKARIDDALDARGLRGLDHVVVLGDPLADFAGGDKEQRIDAGEGQPQRFGLGVVGLAKGDAEPACFGGRTDERDDGLGGLALQLLDDAAAELARSSGDGDSHG